LVGLRGKRNKSKRKRLNGGGHPSGKVLANGGIAKVAFPQSGGVEQVVFILEREETAKAFW